MSPLGTDSAQHHYPTRSSVPNAHSLQPKSDVRTWVPPSLRGSQSSMDVSDSAVSAGYTLRSLRLHPLRGSLSPPSNGRGVRPQHQHGHVPLPPPPLPKLSLRRILEPRDLFATAAGASAVHSPLPSLRFATWLPRVMPAFPRVELQASGRYSADGDYAANRTSSVQQQLYRQYEELHPSPHEQQSYQSVPQTVQVTPPPPPGPGSQTSSGTESASGGVGPSRRRTMTAEERRVARTCTVEGCANYIVDRRRCFRHGGGKRCSIDGCTSSAKQLGLCWRHGGSILCKVEGCTRGVKVKGLCWGHGGGKKKKQTTTAKVSASSTELHPRCLFDGCSNPPVLNSFCDAHCREVAQPGYVFEL